MTFMQKLAAGAAITVLASAYVQQAEAQVTTSSIRGTITNEAGAPVSGATVTIIHVPTNTPSATTTSANGSYSVQGLRVGGPYTITVSGPGISEIRAEGIQTFLGDTANVNLVAPAAADALSLEAVVVTGSSLLVAQTATGPSSTFDLSTLENAPAINRDIKDILRLDPRVYVDEGFNDAVQCAGASPRFNSLTVDGVRLNDNFGLNSNGYPTERIPFSYDSIEQVSIELAPFDVNYGSFTACNINAVTKTGGNTFSGGAFYDFSNEKLNGTRTGDVDRSIGEFEEKRYGFNVGGPILQDKVFFFVSYEKFEGSNLFGRTPEDVRITSAQYNEIIDIAVNQYGYVAGGLPTAIPVEDEKIFAKVDWNITDNQRASFTYNYNDGFNFSESDGGSTQISDGNHYYERGAKLQSYTASLYSDWTSNFSTEVRVSYLDLDNRQIPVAGVEFGEVQVRVGPTTVYLGADDSRHANKLTYDLWNYKIGGTYDWNEHLFTFGYEREDFSVFNLFIQEVQGEWVFNSINDFRLGNFSDFRYENAAGSNDQNDGAADFGYSIDTLYFQDEWEVSDKLTVTAGLRYERYSSSDKPALNASFQTQYGFANDATMDGRDLIQPRVGFTYDYSNNIRFQGGFGLYSGGNPNVWLSNNYSNNGVTLFEYRVRNGNINSFTYPNSGRPFYEVPQQGIDAVAAAAGRGPVNALDPDFEIPSEWKVALGTVIDLDSERFGEWRVQGDILWSKTNESAVVIPLGFTQTGTAPDGRPIYGGNTNDFLLTNADEKGESLILSAAVIKDYGNGIDWSLAYAYTDAKDTNPMTSSVAFSNFANYTTSDPVNIPTATSDYEIAHRFTFRLNVEKEFVQDYATRFSLFGSRNSGAPYSYTFARNSIFENPFSSSRQLAYIPNGASDALISPLSNAAAVTALVNYIDSNDTLSDMKGSISNRNEANDRWWTKFDLRVSQDLPGLRAGDRTQAFLVVENLGNLLNDDWGLLREHGFPGSAELYTISGIDAQGRYIISGFNPNVDSDSVLVNPSLWSIRVGVKYEF
jgi:outer membrane receptor for ferrienterochelin and colicin